MKESVKNFLTEKYNELNHKASYTCLKYHYKYKGINVNLYFDAYDPDSLSLYLILIYEKEYYYTPLNISDSNVQKEYLKNIPQKILERILVNNHLTEFYENMEEHILNNKYIVNSYLKDIIFVNTMKYIKKDSIDLPFWDHIRRTRMQDTTLKKLMARTDISYKVLKAIQDNNSTLVRTDKISRRKKLTVILREKDIII